MVKAWKEQVVIPTYEVGKPEKNPIFLENRVYQGSSGVVYPYPVIESMADEPTPHEYQAVYIENDYIKVMILPELGGRVQMAYDKIKNRHFIYYNHVIKPALVGLAGPWISGGIEFNWPQHHRPSTFMPVDVKIEEGKDGSVTVWVNERERMFHQQGQAGFTLREGCAYLEIHGILYNPTETPQTFLWWANPAVSVNDAYQSVFPPDVNAVFDHGKRAVSSFPIATGTYYKMDYSAGVDISNYKNIYVPTSYMVAKSKYNFEGGYENDTHGGMLHVADHHVSPGKKQWTWGNGDFGRAWDRNLTDTDGPYIELMAGVYTENQPDFSWLMPYEEKSFVQYFMPYRELGIVKNANKDLMLNVDKAGNGIRLLVYATSKQKVDIKVKNTADGMVICAKTVEISPENLFDEVIETGATEWKNLCVELSSTLANGRGSSLLWQPEPDEISPIPDAAEAALKPEEIKTNEQLYLTGLHLEQYRHATWSALDYYEEALRRDPMDVRCNNAVGLWYIRRGRFSKAEPYLRTAVKVLQKRNPNPYDGEPLYNLGLCLKYRSFCPSLTAEESQKLLNEAYDWFYKSTWNKAWQDAGYMACAQISCMKGNYDEALYEVDKALISGWHNHKARALKAWLLNKINGNVPDDFAAYSLSINHFNYGVLFELDRLEEMRDLMRHDANNYDELALDYCAAGLWQEAVALWGMAIQEGAVSPMTRYYMAWALHRMRADEHIVRAALADALQQKPDFCFPNRAEAVLALETAKALNGADSKAPYYLGNLYYDRRQYDLAQENWELSARIEPQFATVHRNLALVYYNKRKDAARALAEMETAFALDETDSRVLMELDQLYKALQRPYDFRLEVLEKHMQQVSERDDLVLERATLLNQLQRYEEAKAIIDSHIFHPWEGGEGKVSGQYQVSRLEIAKRNLIPALAKDKAEDCDMAAIDLSIKLLEECLEFPANIGEGKLYCAQDNDFYYFLGVSYHLKGDDATAKTMYENGTVGPTEPAAALYYNDAKPDKIFYAALCYRALGEEDKARGLFHKLISYGEKHIFDHITMDYFAVSLPDLLVWDGDLDVSNVIHCNYMLALGHYGLGNRAKAEGYLSEVLRLNVNHYGALAMKTLMG